MSTSNTILIEKSRLGDRNSFGQIVRQYQGIVSGIVYGILGDFHKSEDIAQETFLTAWRKLDELRDVEKLPGWLCGIARNLAHHARVKQSKIQTVSIAEAVEIAEQKDDPARILAQNEQNRLIWTALEKIPEKYRLPLVLFYRSEKSIPEIADALEISKDVLSMRLSRARKYLRRELEKQVEGAIAANGPGEFFSLAVVAALPAIARVATIGKTAAATTVGTETTLAASAMVAAPKSGTPSATLFGMSFLGGSWSVWLISNSIFCIFFILGAIPGVWFSVRNAPTLRTRRYLILCSLRAHLLIAFACFSVWAFAPTCMNIMELVQYCGVTVSAGNIINPIGYCAGGLLYVGVALLIIVSPWVYRRILREDTGLIVRKKIVPLEESSLSLTRLEKTYKRFSTACMVMLIWYFASFILGILILATGVIPNRSVYWNFGYFLGEHGIWFGFMVVGIVFYVAFRQFHKRLMATAHDEATFHAVGPVWDRHKTPFLERVFVEWLVYLGCFVAAGLIVALKPSFDYDWIPYYPIPLLQKLVLILAGSMVLAAINAGFPRLRWLVILGGCLLVGYGINGIYRSSLDRGHFILKLDSPDQWPYLFTLIYLNIYVATVALITLALGGLHYYAKWNGKSLRFSLPIKIMTGWCFVGVLMLCFAPRCYSSLRVPYWYLRSVYCKHIELYNEVLRLSPENSYHHISALHRRAESYFKTKQFEPALADYDAVIRIYDELPVTEKTQWKWNICGWYGSRGNVKFALDDLHGAIADYDLADPLGEETRDCNVLYNRGYAYETLGDTEKAGADYMAAIEMLEEPTRTWKRFYETAVPRTGCNDPSKITLEELREIRDRLVR